MKTLSSTLKGARNFGGFLIAFAAFAAVLLWVLQPVQGHLEPTMTHEGRLEGWAYVESSWWGLRVKEYPAAFEKGRFIYQKKPGLSKLVDENLYSIW